MGHYYTIDRFEGNEWTVLEDEQVHTFRVPTTWLPSGAREGDVLRASKSIEESTLTTIQFELDPEARDKRLADARQRRDALQGDVPQLRPRHRLPFLCGLR